MKRMKMHDLQWVKTSPPARSALLENREVKVHSLTELINEIGIPRVPEATTAQEEAIGLLQVAAEVEHALLVQYLYAAYSIQNQDLTKKIADIARQEMGHLITVQNLLLAIQGQPYFERQDASPQLELDPIPFVLEPFTKSVLAQYIVAEMPSRDQLPSDRQSLVDRIIQEAQQAANVQLNRVGLIYAELYWLFQSDDNPQGPWQLPTEGFPAGLHITELADPIVLQDIQADPEEPEWTAFAIASPVFEIVTTREQALNALYRIARQGEGLNNEETSHFEQFLDIYQNFDTIPSPIAFDVPTNPITSDEPPNDPNLEQNWIANANSRLWAKLADLRYQILLLSLNQVLSYRKSEPQERELRSTLIAWTLEDMRFLRRLALLLRKLPRTDSQATDDLKAAIPFQLPQQAFPQIILEKWRLQKSLRDESAQIIASIEPPDLPARNLLQQIQQQNEERIPIIQSQQQVTMRKIYKIHPAIGIARLGNSPDQFFLAPEIPSQPMMELIADGQEIPVQKYKDSGGRLKKQAARFRVFEFEEDDRGNMSQGREITADEAAIEWRVELANRKAASLIFVNESDPPTSPLRNPGIPEADLVIAPQFGSISGKNQRLLASPNGKFQRKEVYLGELHTDNSGRLLVLGGNGISESVPTGLPIRNFANNPGWYDDTSDGPVTAIITFNGQPPREVDEKAWVIVAPPDYAPEIKGIVTLYDIAYQAAVTNGWLTPPAIPSFRDDIFPLLNRAASLRWVNQFAYWNSISRDWQKLSSLTEPDAARLRQEVYDLTIDVVESGILRNLQYTAVQRRMLEQWRDGNFKDDFAVPALPLTLTPDNIDRAALEQGMGGGFFPGIEAGIRMTYPEIYASPFRLTRTAFTHNGVTRSLVAGSVTERMAVPWQADFLKCNSDWWPAQRPDTVLLDPNSSVPNTNWARGIINHRSLIDNHSKLGLVKSTKNAAGEIVYVEEERNSDFPS
jgi:L-Lysine epsilon oxidase N-terminal/Ferritin-like/L-lysine epsilon oxidase C-terminal domain